MVTLLYQNKDTGKMTWAAGNINHRWTQIASTAEKDLPNLTESERKYWNDNSCNIYGERRGPVMPDNSPEGWNIVLNVKHIPDRRHDFDFWHDDYDGAEDGNHLCGTACNVGDAVEQIRGIELGI